MRHGSIYWNPRVSDKVHTGNFIFYSIEIQNANIYSEVDDDNLVYVRSCFIHFTPKDKTLSNENYCKLLLLIKAKVKSKRSDFALGLCLTSANKTIYCLQDISYELLEHPSYSPELVPSDFHLFGLTKEEGIILF